MLIAPEYLGPVVRVADLPGRQYLRSAGTSRMVMPPFKLSKIGTRAFLVLASGIVCQQTSHRHRRCRPSANYEKLIYSDNHYLISPFNCMHSLGGPC